MEISRYISVNFHSVSVCEQYMTTFHELGT